MRVGVGDRFRFHRHFSRLEFVHYELIRIKNLHSLIIRHLLIKATILINWHKEPLQSMLFTEKFRYRHKVYFSKGRCDMHDSSSILSTYEISIQNLEKLTLVFSWNLRIWNVVKERLISQIFEFFPFLLVNKFVLVWGFIVFFQKIFCHDIVFLALRIVNGHIVNLSSDREKHIARQSPRRRRPSKEVEFPLNQAFIFRIQNLFEKMKINEIMRKFLFIINDRSVDIEGKSEAIFRLFFFYPNECIVLFAFLNAWRITRCHLKPMDSIRFSEMNDFDCSEIVLFFSFNSDFFFEFSFECCDSAPSFFNFSTRKKPEILLHVMNHRIATLAISDHSSYHINKTIFRSFVCTALWSLMSKLDGDCHILLVFITIRDFIVGKRSCTAWAVSLHFKSFIDLILIVNRRETPDHAFHKIQIHREIRILNICPASGMIHKPLPISVGLIHIGSTLFYKGFNSDFIFNVLFPINSKCLFYRLFYRETMTVPTSLSLYFVSSHGSIPWDHILDTSSQKMSIVGTSTRKRRAIKEFIAHCFCSFINRSLKSLIFHPKIKDFIHTL